MPPRDQMSRSWSWGWFESMNSGFVDRRGRWLLFILTALVYLRALPGEFVWDDRTFFVENDILPNLNIWDLQAILLRPASYWGENLPLSEWFFLLEHHAFGTFTPAYHLVSLVLYLAIGLLVWRFVENIHESFGNSAKTSLDDARRNQASILLVTSLFLLHPVHVEVVAYITGQQHLLSVFFSLLSINILWAAWKRKELHRKRNLVAAIACYYLAVLAKYQAISTGIFIPLLWLALRRKGDDKPAKFWIYWGLINIPVVLWLNFSTRDYGDIGQTGLPFLVAASRGIRILGAHLIIALKPYPLNFGYPFEHSWSFDVNFVAGSLMLCGLATSMVFFRRSITTIGLLIFLVYLFPVLQVFVGVSNATIFDRYLFLPVIGICLILERCLTAAASRQKHLQWLPGAMAVALVIALAVMSFSYIPKFHSNLESTEHAYRTFPEWK
jgi:hypothetical protein